MAALAPVHRPCFVVDVEKFSKRNNQGQTDVQRRLCWLTANAIRAAGLEPLNCDMEPKGDGQLFAFPGDVDPRVIPRLVVHLNEALHRVNAVRGPGGRIRLRAAINIGLVSPDVGAGLGGHAVIDVCRLVDSAPVRQALRAGFGDLALIVPDHLYRDYFAEGHDGVHFAPFQKVTVTVESKGFDAEGWIQTDFPWPVPEKIGPYKPSEIPAAERPASSRSEWLRLWLAAGGGTAGGAYVTYEVMRHLSASGQPPQSTEPHEGSASATDDDDSADENDHLDHGDSPDHDDRPDDAGENDDLQEEEA